MHMGALGYAFYFQGTASPQCAPEKKDSKACAERKGDRGKEVELSPQPSVRGRAAPWGQIAGPRTQASWGGGGGLGLLGVSQKGASPRASAIRPKAPRPWHLPQNLQWPTAVPVWVP